MTGKIPRKWKWPKVLCDGNIRTLKEKRYLYFYIFKVAEFEFEVKIAKFKIWIQCGGSKIRKIVRFA